MVKLLSIALLFSLQGASQSPDFWVLLTDKDNTPFSQSAPEQFLSQRALDRRADQNIDIDIKDLPVDPAYISEISAIEGLEFRFASKWFNALSVRCDSSILSQIEALPYVSLIKSVNVLRPKEWPKQEAPLNLEQSSSRLPIEYGASANQIMDLNGQALHEQGFEGDGMVIAILDAGFDRVDSIASFEHLFLEERILSTKDFVEGDNEVYDEHFHGRAVLSTIAAIKEGEVYGTAVDASFHLLRTEDVGSETTIEEWNWIAAAEYADSAGADILNTSLGYTTMDTELESYSYEDMDGNTAWITRGADIAASRGMLVVNSAGNSGSNDWHFIGAPADGDSVLAIGSVDMDSMHTSFSSFGPSSDGRVKPNVCAQGRTAFGINEDDLVVPLNGTSFSSPITAGLAACLWQAVPQASSMEVYRAIEMSAHLFDDPNDSLGHGIPNFGSAMDILQEMTSTVPEFDESGLLIFPNPASDQISLMISDDSYPEDRIRIVDAIGKEQKVILNRVTTNLYRIDISNLSKGAYLILFEGNAGLGAKRFVKN